MSIPAYNDGKAADALRTIGEVAKALNIRPHVLRYWEEQFTSLRPVKRSGGRRYYRPEDVALVAHIDQLVHHQGYTLRGAQQVMDGQKTVFHTPSAVLSGDVSVKLRQIRDRLALALAAT